MLNLFTTIIYAGKDIDSSADNDFFLYNLIHRCIAHHSSSTDRHLLRLQTFEMKETISIVYIKSTAGELSKFKGKQKSQISFTSSFTSTLSNNCQLIHLQFEIWKFGQRPKHTKMIQLSLDMLYTAVRHSNLDANKLSNQGPTDISATLEVIQTVATILLNENKVSSEGFMALAQVLRMNQSLVTLNIINNLLLDDGIQALCEAVKSNQTLKQLWIHNTKISFVGIKLISDMLRAKTVTLENLAIGDNHITDDGAVLIAETLKVNSSINWLHMRSSSVTDRGVLALVKAIEIRHKKFINFYVIDDCPVSDKARQALTLSLQKSSEDLF